MYQPHQGGRALRTIFEAPPVRFVAGGEKRELAGLSGSASAKGLDLVLTVVNPSSSLPVEAEISLAERSVQSASAVVVHDQDISAHNTLDEPTRVRTVAASVAISATEWRHTFPPASVTRFQIKMDRS